MGRKTKRRSFLKSKKSRWKFRRKRELKPKRKAKSRTLKWKTMRKKAASSAK